MVKNDPKTSNIKKTTEKYRLITAELTKQSIRIKHDIEVAREMLKNKITSDDAQAKNMLTSGLANKIVNDRALAIDRKENQAAYERGEILKFW